MAFDGEPFREEGEHGVLRPGYAELFGALADVDLDELTARVNGHLEERKVTFGSRPFIIDPIPRMITRRGGAADGRTGPACAGPEPLPARRLRGASNRAGGHRLQRRH